MKLFFAVASLVAASTDIEQSSLLQSNVKKDKDRVDIASLLERGSVELSKLDASESDQHVSQTMSQLFQKIQQTSVSVLQLPQTEQAALLQRAHQGQEMRTFLDSFVDLPEKVKSKVIKAVLSSEEMQDTYKALPEEDQRAVLLELGQNPFDGTTQKKSGPTTRRYTTIEDGVKTKVTETTNPNGHYHRTAHNKYGTDTTTRGKDGYSHQHSYSHNGNGGQARTRTQSKKGSWNHEHEHDHTYDPNTGTTVTRTKTVSEGDGILDLTHEHDHQHRNVAGVGTTSYTGTKTDSAVGTHTHSHDHYHNDVTGDFDSEANSKSDGPKWDKIFNGDEDNR